MRTERKAGTDNDIKGNRSEKPQGAFKDEKVLQRVISSGRTCAVFDACTAGKEAPAFAKFLKQYRSLGILDFEGLDMKQIIAELKAFFPSEIKYQYRKFATYFSL